MEYFCPDVPCRGDGSCLQPCRCECDWDFTFCKTCKKSLENCICEEGDGDYYTLPYTCTCGHSEHGGYCPNDHCVPILCPICRIKTTKLEAECQYGTCVNCAVARFVGGWEVLLFDGHLKNIFEDEEKWRKFACDKMLRIYSSK